jgi:hypothetical protein
MSSSLLHKTPRVVTEAEPIFIPDPKHPGDMVHINVQWTDTSQNPEKLMSYIGIGIVKEVDKDYLDGFWFMWIEAEGNLFSATCPDYETLSKSRKKKFNR